MAHHVDGIKMEAAVECEGFRMGSLRAGVGIEEMHGIIGMVQSGEMRMPLLLKDHVQ